MTILIVEDNATNALVLKHLAKKCVDEDILVEADAAHALELCHTRPIDLLIVDHILPGMTGLQFIKAVRMMQRYDAVPIVMVTADHDRSLREAAMAAGVTEFLNKPVEAIAFRKLLAGYRAAGTSNASALV
jgi:two-component system chemotaxis response regulator CheY